MTGRFVKVVPDMTPEELCRWSAEKLCGWKEDCVFGITEEKWWAEHSGPLANFIVKVKDWRPDSDQSPGWQILKVIEVMEELGYSFVLYSSSLVSSVMVGATAIFSLGVYPPLYLEGHHEITQDTPCGKNENKFLAILQAAHAAREGE